MKNKNIKYFIFLIVLFIFIWVFYKIDKLLYDANNTINDSSYMYNEYTKSDDNKYLLHIKNDENNYVSFEIILSEDNRILYMCDDVYRAYDLKSISWSNNDIIIVSGDVGTIVYKYKNGTWIKSK